LKDSFTPSVIDGKIVLIAGAGDTFTFIESWFKNTVRAKIILKKTLTTRVD